MRLFAIGIALLCLSWTATAREIQRLTQISVNDDPAAGRVRYDCRLELRNLASETTYQARVDVTYAIRENQLIWEEFALGPASRSFSAASAGGYTVASNNSLVRIPERPVTTLE
jgi:hypothetical protein